MISWVTDSVEEALWWKGFLVELVSKDRWEASGRVEMEEGPRHTLGQQADDEMSRGSFMLGRTRGRRLVSGGS